MTTTPMDVMDDEGIIYSHDVLAEIILNGDKVMSHKIITEVDDKMGKSIISELYLKERKSKRRSLLLSRKTIVRAGQKIAKAIVENIVDMSVKKEEIEQFLKQVKKCK